MTEIHISHRQLIEPALKTVIANQATAQLIESLRIGQLLKAELVVIHNKTYLLLEGFKIALPEETVKQLALIDQQSVNLKVKSLQEPIQLQLITKDITTSKTKSANIKEPIGIQPNVQQEANNNGEKKTINVNDKLNEKLILEARSYLRKPLQTLLTNQPISREKKAQPPSSSLNHSLASTLIKNPTSENVSLNSSKLNSLANPGSKHTQPAKASHLSDLLNRIVESSVKSVPKEREKKNIAVAKNNFSGNILNSDNLLKTNQITNDSAKNLLQTSKVQGQQTLLRSFSKTGTTTALDINTKVPLQTQDAILIKTGKTTQSSISSHQKPDNSTVIQPSVSKLQNKSSDKIKLPLENKLNISQPDRATISQKQETLISAKSADKFEVQITVPDKDKFPLLTDKIHAAYTRHSQTNQSSKGSLNKLLSQLQRLNQWTAENKGNKHSSSGAKAEKFASDLKLTITDLFRYINNKNSIKSPKSIEKALKQSGTFLEKRLDKNKLNVENQSSKSRSELTIHKDFKANLLRILTTALYNLAKMKAQTTQAETSNKSNTKASSQSSTTALKLPNTEKNNQSKINIMNSVRTNLKKFTTGTNSNVRLADLELITKEVLKSTQSALSKTQLNQLTNLRPESFNQQWLFEIPVLNKQEVDIFSLYLKQQQSDDDDETKPSKKGWSIILQFDIAHLGKIRAMLSWENEKVKVRFITDQDRTTSLVDNELNYFHKKLAEKNIAVEQLSVEQSELDELNIQFSGTTSNE